ncbi:hypothetical protein ABUW04_15505 [Streptacidiphilus sp. N1-10]|uniref:Secreted protein n=1 Tax=Streptacidiphilus jeojiensis TaxID=3229225 RepID=A0ABV6XNY6_9ACTN
MFTSAMDRCPAGAAWVGCVAVLAAVDLVVAAGAAVRVAVCEADGEGVADFVVALGDGEGEADGPGDALAPPPLPAVATAEDGSATWAVPTPFGGDGQKTTTSVATTAAVSASHHPRADRVRCFLRAMACLSPRR